nr:CCR4-NOT transcription complex subunit 3-like [Camelus dromedarius]
MARKERGEGETERGGREGGKREVFLDCPLSFKHFIGFRESEEQEEEEREENRREREGGERAPLPPWPPGCRRHLDRAPVSDERALRPPAAAPRPAPRTPLREPAAELSPRRADACAHRTPAPSQRNVGALAFCCWGLALVSGWATFQQLSPSRNFSFRLFPEAAPGAPGRLPSPPAPGEDAAGGGGGGGGAKWSGWARRSGNACGGCGSSASAWSWSSWWTSRPAWAKPTSSASSSSSASCCLTSRWCPRPRVWPS